VEWTRVNLPVIDAAIGRHRAHLEATG